MGQKSSFQKSVIKTLQGQVETVVIEVSNQLINDFDYSPDNRNIALACKQLRICDLQRQIDIAVLQHSTYVISVKYSSDGQLIASSDVDSYIYIWNAKTNKQMYKIHTQFVYQKKFKISPDNQFIASGSTDFKIKLWNFNVNQTQILEHRNEVAAIEYLRKQILITATFEGDVQFWNLQTIRFSTKFMQDRRYLTKLNSSANGQQVLSAYTDGTIKYWDAKSKKIIRMFYQNIDLRWTAKVGYRDGFRQFSN